MFKYALLAFFLITCICWLYQPYEINPNDSLIDKYRPSLNQSIPSNTADSIFRIKTKFDKRATAYNTVKAVQLIQFNN